MSPVAPSSWIERLEALARHEPDAGLDQAMQWLAAAAPDVDPVMTRRVMLVKASVDIRRGRSEDGARVLRAVNAWAVERDELFLRARSHRHLGALFRRVGDPALTLEHAVASVELLDASAPAATRAEHVLILADALAVCGSHDESLRRYEEAFALSLDAEDLRMRLLVLNNMAYSLWEAGRWEDGLRAADRMVAVSASHHLPLQLYALDTVARAYLSAGRLDEAARTMQPVLDPAAVGDSEEIAIGLLTMAEILRLSGDLVQAQEVLDRCRLVTQQDILRAVAVQLLGEQAELHAAAGRFSQAYEVFRSFHRQTLDLHALEREARARTLQAIFEATEARRDSEHFRELSYRDPLTQLHNRRYVDEHLTSLLLAGVESGAPLTVAFVDLDRFKVVNDTFSHDVGDEVLRQVAGVLEEETAHVEGGFAARMGGEEFLLVLPGVDSATASELLETTRLRLEQHGWEAITHAVPVTASIGAATAPDDGVDRVLLLACADHRLYTAKRSGRNRVVQAKVTQPPPLTVS